MEAESKLKLDNFLKALGIAMFKYMFVTLTLGFLIGFTIGKYI